MKYVAFKVKHIFEHFCRSFVNTALVYLAVMIADRYIYVNNVVLSNPMALSLRVEKYWFYVG